MWSSRRLQTSRIFAVLASSTYTQTLATAAFSSPAFTRRQQPCSPQQPHELTAQQKSASVGSRRKKFNWQQMSFFGSPAEGGIRRIGRDAMTEIVEDVSNGSREESGYVIIDVRGHDEVQYTGKLDEVVETLPLPYIAEGALVMGEEDFKKSFGFEKPGLDETIVFTCKAGIRSQHAGQMAKMAGYTDIIDYAGGSNEWFS